MADPSGLISTYSLLLIFNISWIISFSASLLLKRELRIICLMVALISSILVINFSLVDVYCVECDCEEQEIEGVNETVCDTVVGVRQVVPISELLYIHAYGFFPLQAILLIYFFVTDGMNILKRDPKDRE